MKLINKIWANRWMKCVVLKGTITPDYCTIGACSVLNKKYDFPEYSIVAGNPVALKRTGYWRDINSEFEITQKYKTFGDQL